MTRGAAIRRTDPVGLPSHLAAIRVVTQRPNGLLTREQAAQVLGIHARTLDRWARCGRVLTIDFGGTVRVPVTETRRLQSTPSHGNRHERWE